jgi:hypothetical protein
MNYKKSKTGEKIQIAANEWNAVRDATLNSVEKHENPSLRRTSIAADYVLVKNETNRTIPRGGILEIVGTFNDDEKIILRGSVPRNIKHDDPDADPVTDTDAIFAVMFDSITAGEFGKAKINGTTKANVNVKDTNQFYLQTVPGITDYLQTTEKPKNARLLIKSKTTGATAQIPIVIGSGAATAGVFPVIMVSDGGGTQGSDEETATWTYTVIDATTNETLAEELNPAASPNLWKRPSLGMLTPATAGFAFYNTENQLVIGWTNEVQVTDTCKLLEQTE